ncbi:MAG: 30S ribosomal protein S12 methylthiotransferase RimO [Longimicrobiales bacterium]
MKAVSGSQFEVGPPEGPRVGLVTLGCDKNTVDSERMLAALVASGARVTSEVESAEVVIINTCGFIDSAKEQSVDTMLEACALKASGDVQAVVAVGCMVQRYQEQLEEEIPEVDLFLGLAELGRLVPELRARGLVEEPSVPNMEKPLRILTTDTPHTSFLKISEGCDHTCAFCAIPHMRGLHRSADMTGLIAEARALGEQGVRELNVISQDTTWYGRDLRRKDRSAPLLPDLLRGLLDGTEVDWFRLFYMYPSGITRDLVELLAKEPRLLPYLDMPLQHGSDRMLERMRRPERQAQIRERVGWLRDQVPDLTLRTTVIVGFPGETEEDFSEMLGLLEELRFDRVGAFPYSIEEGTPAADMEDQIPESLKRERLEALLDHQRGLSYEANAELIGRKMTVLVDYIISDDPDYGAAGRTKGQALEVDGQTHLLKGESASGESPRFKPGDFVVAEIVDAEEYDLIGRVLDG